MTKKLLNPGSYQDQINIALLFLRTTLGIFMLVHGTGKLITLFEGGPIEFADPIGIGQSASFMLAIFAEFVCSLFLIFGVATRFAAFMFLFVFITIAIAGAGKISVDNLIYKRINS